MRPISILACGVALTGVFLRLYRPWQMRWGATREEEVAEYPGDDLLPVAEFHPTRATTIAARPEEIWPWIVQIGFGRAGFYANDTTAFRVRAFKPHRWLLWTKPDSTWCWTLRPLDNERTRVISRIKVKYQWREPAVIVSLLLMELGDFFMNRRELLGIRRRAEARASARRSRSGEASTATPAV